MRPLRLIPSLHRAAHRVGLYLNAGHPARLSQGEAHILALLATCASTTVGELHKGLAHKRSTLTSILDRLAERGLITRHVGEADRRTFVVMLTPKGRRVARDVYARVLELERAVSAQVAEADVRGYARVVAAIEAEAASRAAGR
ncbi:MAG TPA: MarR family transcriptional regulator [Vicinamibacterales bacterium]|nr:MarR family transcriptional regulator [Vicinamibacterales bacterium]